MAMCVGTQVIEIESLLLKVCRWMRQMGFFVTHISRSNSILILNSARTADHYSTATVTIFFPSICEATVIAIDLLR
jgi:hypothetical protein